MKASSTVRILDRTIGSLGCFVLSLLQFLTRNEKKDKSVDNILLIELFEMGASIMAYPAVHYVKKNFPDATVFVLTTQSIKSSWLKIQGIDESNIFAIRESNVFVFLWSFFKIDHQLNKRKIDVIIDFELFYRITAIFSFFIRSRYKAGFFRYNMEGLYRGSIHNIRCHFNQNSHISKNFLALTKTALTFSNEYPEYKNSISVDELTYDSYQSNPEIFQSLKQRMQESFAAPYILISPDVGPNLSCRNYPIGQLVSVINTLLQTHPDFRIFLIGTDENIAICNSITDAVQSDRLMSFAGKTTMDELFELLLHSRLLISNDNGPVHFATLTNTPTLALYSTDSPFVYGSLGKCLILYSFYQCSPCIMAYNHKNSECMDNKCLQAISPFTVTEFAEKILADEVTFRTINNTTPYLL